MALYEYRCQRHGLQEVRQPMGQTLDAMPCPVCNDRAVRVFSAPMVSIASRAVVAAIDRTEKTRDEPDVVTVLPRRGSRRRTPIAPSNPILRRLPRP